MNSFEEDNGHAQYPEGDGGAEGHDHPAEAGENQTLDGVAVGHRHEDSQGGQHGGPDQPTGTAGAGVGKGGVEGIEFCHDEVDGERTPEDESAPVRHVVRHHKQIRLVAKILLPVHLCEHVF